MADNMEEQADTILLQKIVKIFEETRASHATHIRKLKDLSAIRSSSPILFTPAFLRAITPLLGFQRRTASSERLVRFVSIFSSTRDANNASLCDSFLEAFLHFLLVAAAAADKTVRFRGCQIISEIIMRLPDDAEVSNEIWDEVVETMNARVCDKSPIVRTFAVRAVSRFVNDSENSDILDILLENLPPEQNPVVRKTIVLSLPPTNATSAAIISCTLDVNESVRKAAYCVLASKFPLQSLSIKLRTSILQRGLADRSAAVRGECLKLLRDEWLVKSCKGDPIELLKYLDVETYETVGDCVMDVLLKAKLIKVPADQSIRQFLSPAAIEETEGCCKSQLMEPEVALYWRAICKHFREEAHQKGSAAATKVGTEAAIYAAEASDDNDILERVLPATVSDYIEIVKAHLDAGPNHRFASRQLLLLCAMLDFSDATNWKFASTFVQDLLQQPLEYFTDEDGEKVLIGDGFSLGGDRNWADAVSALAKKVYAAPGEFEEFVLCILEKLAQPCRERTADFMQWIHCLAVTGLLLESSKSFRWMQGKAIEPPELLHSLLLPGVRHAHLDVQRVSIRSLGLYGLLQKKLSDELVKQLRLSFVKGPSPISAMACQALIDLAMWHGPEEIDRAVSHDLSSQFIDHNMGFCPIEFADSNGNQDVALLDLLFSGFSRPDWCEGEDIDENESVLAVLGEGFAKILLLSESYRGMHTSAHPLFLAKLIGLYFSDKTKELYRLRQCLSVFFENYPYVSVSHKKYLSKAFIPVIRSMWPGIDGNGGRSPTVISNMRKLAIQASRFMLQMMQVSLLSREGKIIDGNNDKDLPKTDDGTENSYDLESGEAVLALRIASEVANFSTKKKNAAEKSYCAALCRILVQLRFNPQEEEEGVTKIMRWLWNHVASAVSTEKDILKELKRMVESLEPADDNNFSADDAKSVLDKLGIEMKVETVNMEIPPTPIPQPRRTRYRRKPQTDDESSDEEEYAKEPASVAPSNVGGMSIRSQRASKTVALTKLTTTDEDNNSGVTSDEEDSDVSDE
ncbi:condensin complex subunit 3 [Impatiens glandulifera]|uniref:condensin complex subunit 3 n=1 Tax=Impatiens glandulifera TaxID=253017 RepID=UPI001FB149C5|nr:condensin complex subunit 3 [Impatiens glandulifera]